MGLQLKLPINKEKQKLYKKLEHQEYLLEKLLTKVSELQEKVIL